MNTATATLRPRPAIGSEATVRAIQSVRRGEVGVVVSITSRGFVTLRMKQGYPDASFPLFELKWDAS